MFQKDRWIQSSLFVNETKYNKLCLRKSLTMKLAISDFHRDMWNEWQPLSRAKCIPAYSYASSYTSCVSTPPYQFMFNVKTKFVLHELSSLLWPKSGIWTLNIFTKNYVEDCEVRNGLTFASTNDAINIQILTTSLNKSQTT
jgi:hypothetical protein